MNAFENKNIFFKVKWLLLDEAEQNLNRSEKNGKWTSFVSLEMKPKEKKSTFFNVSCEKNTIFLEFKT
jgi:L-rhamnose mutarotase